MNLGAIGSNNTMQSMSAMWRRPDATSMSGPQAQKAEGNSRPDFADIFSKTDEDDSGGVDATELSSLAQMISEATGEDVDAETLLSTYDEDGDGQLDEDETSTLLEANKPEGPPPGGMMGGMQGSPPPDPSQLFGDADEDEDGSLDATEAETLAELISEATGETIDVEDLLAAYDEDEDGVLSESETQAALEANRPEGPPPPPPGGEMMEATGNTGFGISNGIEHYMQMASFGSDQSQSMNTASMFGDQGNGYASMNAHPFHTRI